MSNHRFWRKENGAARIPHAAAQVYFLKVIKELFVESSKVLEEVCAEHYAAAGLPIDATLGVATPPRVFFIDEKRGQFRKAKRGYPIAPNCGKQARGDLVGSIRVQNAAPERSSLRVAIREFDKLVERTVVDDCVRI